MANPQLENGYTKISNEVLESLVKAGLLGSEFKVILFIIRKTYGWDKKRDTISLSQFISGTNLSRPTIVKTLKNLVMKNMLVKTVLPHSKIAYMYQKNYNEWVVNPALLVKHDSIGSKDRLTNIGKDGLTHKRKKETIQKDSLIKKYKPTFLKDKITT